MHKRPRIWTILDTKMKLSTSVMIISEHNDLVEYYALLCNFINEERLLNYEYFKQFSLLLIPLSNLITTVD